MTTMESHVFRKGPVARKSPVVSRAAQWVLNDQRLSKESCTRPRDTVGWDPLRPATWRRLAALRRGAPPRG